MMGSRTRWREGQFFQNHVEAMVSTRDAFLNVVFPRAMQKNSAQRQTEMFRKVVKRGGATSVTERDFHLTSIKLW